MQQLAPDDAERLSRLITHERLSSYLFPMQSPASALVLHDWNLDASVAVLGTCAAVEVIVRNSMDAALVDWSLRHGHADWLDAAPLDRKARAAVSAARERQMRSSRSTFVTRPIADLSFGFWRYLVTSKYLTSLWVPALRHAFRHGPEYAFDRQRRVHFILDNLVYLRNRAAHHEPIHQRNLLRDNQLAIEIAAMIDPVAADWVARRSTIPAVVAAKPPRGK